VYVANSKRLTNEGAKKMIATAIAKARKAGIAIYRNYDRSMQFRWIFGFWAESADRTGIALRPLS
jgi:hypothetical protein